MFKLINLMLVPALVLATFVLAAAAANINEQLVMPSDEQETRLLKGDQYKDFCLVTRDLIGDLLKKEERVTSLVAGSLLQGGISLGLSQYEYQETKLDEINRLYRRQESKDPDNRVYLALIGVLDETKNVASRRAISQLEGLASFAPQRIGKLIRRACEAVNQCEAGVRRAFDFLSGKLALGAGAKVEEVACQTSMGILQANNICKFILTITDRRQAGLTYSPQFVIATS